jgi:hypothetical protein
MTTPTPEAMCERLRLDAEQILDGTVLGVDEAAILRTAADLIQQQRAEIERLSALVEESLYHLRLDEAAKAYHERALNALGKE